MAPHLPRHPKEDGLLLAMNVCVCGYLVSILPLCQYARSIGESPGTPLLPYDVAVIRGYLMNSINCRNRFAVLILILTIVATALPLSAATATLPPGTKLQVRITERVSSDTARPGETFHGTIAQPVVVNGKTLFNKGTEVKGEVL